MEADSITPFSHLDDFVQFFQIIYDNKNRITARLILKGRDKFT